MGCTSWHNAAPRTAANSSSFGAPIAEAPDAAPAAQQSTGWTTTPLAVVSEAVEVKEGGVPLVYLVETPGAFRVHDRTAGQDLAQGFAAGRSIIRVDGRGGVVFSRETLVPGPLAKDHRYVIYRDPTGPNMARQGVFQPIPLRNGAGTRAPNALPEAPGAGADSGVNGQASQDHGGRNDQGGPHADR